MRRVSARFFFGQGVGWMEGVCGRDWPGRGCVAGAGREKISRRVLYTRLLCARMGPASLERIASGGPTMSRVCGFREGSSGGTEGRPRRVVQVATYTSGRPYRPARGRYAERTAVEETNPYESPRADAAPTMPPSQVSNGTDYSPAFNRAMRIGLGIQAVLGVLTALVLDAGQQTHRAFWVAMLCQWAAVFIILFRRPMSPTAVDLAIVRYGIILLLVVVAGFGPMLLQVIGIPSR